MSSALCRSLRPKEAIEETYGALNAYWAMLPGNSRFNVRQLWLQNNHYADLSFVFAPCTGSVEAKMLEDEYLMTFETVDGSPFLPLRGAAEPFLVHVVRVEIPCLAGVNTMSASVVMRPTVLADGPHDIAFEKLRSHLSPLESFIKPATGQLPTVRG
jgi:hypothetical protein